VIHILTHIRTPRIEYIAAFISMRLGLTVTCTSLDKVEDQLNYINYTDEHLPHSIRVYNSKFLETSAVEEEFAPDFSIEDDMIQLFPGSSNYTISFDILASIFYCLSRYEEYQNFVPDQHDRFPSIASHAYANDYLQRPVVDEWMLYLRKTIELHWNIKLPEPTPFEILPTIDVDISWAYKHRSLAHRIGSQLKKIVKGQLEEWKEQRNAYQLGDDPYDTFSYIRDQCKQLESRYFFLCRKNSPYDTSYFLDNTAFSQLIKEHYAAFSIGIHPSYLSYTDQEKLIEEKQWLESVIGTPILSSRQHFLRFTLPKTYRNLIEIGVSDEWSMGYADQCGFRAGTSMPFYFYDLNKEQATTLLVHPFCLMDVTLKDYMKLSIEEARDTIHQIRNNLQEVNGQLCFIWHNSSFSILGGWQGWETVFEELVKSERIDDLGRP